MAHLSSPNPASHEAVIERAAFLGDVGSPLGPAWYMIGTAVLELVWRGQSRESHRS